jgi:hypothetical protein
MSERMPKISCDFNACGLSGEPDDKAFYRLNQEQLTEIGPVEGMRVYAYMDDDPDEVTFCEATLSKSRLGWRAIPIEGTWKWLSHGEFDRVL